ncbi:TetR/AcrR family transcriptional regulator [Microlunatus ginsengisoli]|uniref:HTH tetR-type domain-containing protein n=1 Tax=Microlunatus ginsengisoli TaxID=363863 RepID=A0ABP6ZV50_9ACTN
MSDPVPQPRRRLGAEERRDQLVSAAVAVLAAQGYRGATADAIVQQAGVSKGLLWHYFADLDDLMVQTARRTVMAIARSIGGRLDLTAPAPVVIRDAIRAATRILTEHRAERRAVQEIIANLRTPDGSQRLSLADYEDMFAAQEAIFRRGQREGDINPSLDPRILAVSYQAAVDGMLDYLEEHPDLDKDRYAADLATILLDGARSPHPR